MKGVIYARYSSDNQREESIEGQIRDNRAFAERNGIEIIGTYIDRAYSARTDKRPDFQRMIRDSAKKKYDVVIVWKLDRFARNRYVSAKYKNILKKNGVKVISATEPISGEPVGIMVESILEGSAEYYSVNLAENVVRGMTDNVLNGEFNGGVVPLGYTIDHEKHLEDLEKQRQELSLQIAQEELAQPALTRDQIVFWLHRFRKLDTSKVEHRRRLINSFVNAVILYDDHLVFMGNYKDGSKTVTFAELEAAGLGSDLNALAVPLKSPEPSRFWAFSFILRTFTHCS